MKRVYLFLIVLLLTLCVAVCAQAAEIKPLGEDHLEADLQNGVFCAGFSDADKIESGGWFTMHLYLEDHYAAQDIESLAAGDVVYVNGVPWTVRELIRHDADDPGYVNCYEIYTEEEIDGYIVFTAAGDGCYLCVMNDWTPVYHVADQKIMLPLPDAFEFDYAGSEDIGGMDDLLDALQGEPFTPYNTTCVFDDGLLVRVTHYSYPEGPEIARETSSEAPVWEFCHGVREGLETANIACYKNDCEEGPSEVEMTEEEKENIRLLAMDGVVTDKANDTSVTGGTWSYVFTSPEGQYLLSIEMYKGWIVGADGMYNYSR